MAAVERFSLSEKAPMTLKLWISCNNLDDTDVLSKSDPFVVLSLSGKEGELGRTETIKDNLNPVFQETFLIDYQFQDRQHLELSVYDCDDPKDPDLSRHDPLGTASVPIGEIVAARDGKLTRPLKSPKGNKNSTISIGFKEATEDSGVHDTVKFRVKGINLDKMDIIGLSDPYLLVYRGRDDKQIYRSEVIMKTLNPTWEPFSISVWSLCSGDYLQKLRIECYDWDKIGSDDFIGSFSTTLKELIDNGSSDEYPLINPAKVNARGYINSGTLRFDEVELIPKFSLLEFVRGGTNLNCAIAVDFTASNGAPNEMRSLHYTSGQSPNYYEQAILAVGEVIQDYNLKNEFVAVGFGAKIPPNGELSHNFPLGLRSPADPCRGIQGVIQAYKNCVNRIQFFGPTHFAPLIDDVAQKAASDAHSADNYHVLLILTDGVVADFDDTKKAIINASHFPVSIIIIGIGTEDFSKMVVLDSDDKLLSHKGETAVRDIVQFVHFEEHFFKKGRDSRVGRSELAKRVLAEVPGQLTGFMEMKGYRPRPTVAAIDLPQGALGVDALSAEDDGASGGAP